MAAAMIGWRLNSARQFEGRIKLAHEFDLQERMQFHAVLRHANLLVKNVKEPNAFHTYYPGVREAPEMRFRLGKLSRQSLPHFSKVLPLQ